MKLTDPTELLAEVSVERYNELLAVAKARGAKKSETSSSKPASKLLEYLEPNFTFGDPAALAAPAEVSQDVGGSQQVIKSKVYALGDFVDTDAVSQGVQDRCQMKVH